MEISFLIPVFIAIIAIAVALIIYLLQKRDSAKIALKTGSYKTPLPQLSFSGYNLLPNKTYRIIYGLNFMKKKIISYYEFPLTVGNNGEKTLNDINIFFTVKKKSPLIADSSFLKYSSPLEDSIISRKYHEQKTNKMIAYNIKYLNPLASVTLEEPLILMKTEIELTSRTKIKARVKFVFKLDIIFNAKDYKTQQFKFVIEVIEANDLDDIQRIVTQEYSKMKTIKFKDYYPEIFTFFPTIDFIGKKENERIYRARVDDENVRKLEYKGKWKFKV